MSSAKTPGKRPGGSAKDAANKAGSLNKSPTVGGVQHAREGADVRGRVAFAERLSVLADSAGGMEALSQVSGVGLSTLRRLGNPNLTNEPGRDTLLAIAGATGANPMWLIAGSLPRLMADEIPVNTCAGSPAPSMTHFGIGVGLKAYIGGDIEAIEVTELVGATSELPAEVDIGDVVVYDGHQTDPGSGLFVCEKRGKRAVLWLSVRGAVVEDSDGEEWPLNDAGAVSGLIIRGRAVLVWRPLRF